MNKDNANLTAYIGTYTKNESKGIYSFSFNTESGKISDIKQAAEIKNPTYLTLDKENSLLYSVAKEDENGGIASFIINGDSSTLKYLNSQTLKGAPPCHISIANDYSHIFSANYHKGEVISYPLNKYGCLQEPLSIIKHSGSGPNTKIQDKPHTHYVAMTPCNNYVCAVDLGIDKLMVYKYNNGYLTETDKSISLKPGCGPRHLAFHPTNRFAYILTELSSEVIVLEFDSSTCTFKEIQYISTLPNDFAGDNLGSAINISTDGNYLYTSNRGHDSIATFKIDLSTGQLSFITATSTKGEHPRDFTLSPDGKFLIVSNLDSNNIVVFSIDSMTGIPSKVIDSVSIPEPVCIRFLNTLK